MKKLLAALSLMLCTTAFVPMAHAIVWTTSPDANTVAFGQTVLAGANQVNFLSNANQPAGIFGAGFTMTGTSVGIKFDSDLYTWDTYVPGGYYDAFIVTVSTLGYYWNLSPADPVASGPSTFVWGGKTEGGLESYVTAPTNADFISLTSVDPTTFYVSLVLDTKTLPYSDTVYPSYGSFHVNPVPEPGTILLLGSGLFGLAIYGKRRKKV